MTRLALGTVQFGLEYGIANKSGQISLNEAGRILNVAKEAGFDLLDTAMVYGESEEVLGRLGVAGFRVVTKLPALPNSVVDVSEWVESQVQSSLERLGVDSVYGLLLHYSGDLFGIHCKEFITALEHTKASGVAQKIGVSIYDPSELGPVSQSLDIEIVQAPLNLVDRRLESSGWLQRLSQAGVEIHTRSSFLQGLLLMPRNKVPAEFERWSAIWNAWHHNLSERQVSAATACLAYPLSFPEVSRVVVGVDCENQLRALVQCSLEEITLEDWSFMSSNDQNLINPTNWSKG